MSTRVLSSRDLGGASLQVVQGDITDLDVDAITNAANDHLWMGSGVAGAIRSRGGASIEAEAVAQGPVPVGSAVATSAGQLPALHVIHGAVMGQDLRTDLGTVARTTRSVLQLAGEMGLATLAMPLLGTGVGGLDVGQVAATMVRELARGVSDGHCRGMTVMLVGYDEAAAIAIQGAVASLGEAPGPP